MARLVMEMAAHIVGRVMLACKASSYPDGDAAFTTAHGTSLAKSVKTMDCGTAEGTVVTTYEAYLTKFSEENCSAALGANGDKMYL